MRILLLCTVFFCSTFAEEARRPVLQFGLRHLLVASCGCALVASCFQSDVRQWIADREIRKEAALLSDRLSGLPVTIDYNTLTFDDRNLPIYRALVEKLLEQKKYEELFVFFEERSKSESGESQKLGDYWWVIFSLDGDDTRRFLEIALGEPKADLNLDYLQRFLVRLSVEQKTSASRYLAAYLSNEGLNESAYAMAESFKLSKYLHFLPEGRQPLRFDVLIRGRYRDSPDALRQFLPFVDPTYGVSVESLEELVQRDEVELFKWIRDHPQVDVFIKSELFAEALTKAKSHRILGSLGDRVDSNKLMNDVREKIKSDTPTSLLSVLVEMGVDPRRLGEPFLVDVIRAGNVEWSRWLLNRGLVLDKESR